MAQKLFDKASLVMIPSQYKEGKIYNIKPEDQSSSFEFERGSAATKVNSDGLIEYIGKGEELVTNGTFDADSDWLKTGDWSINGGVAIGVSSGNLSQNLSYEANEYYLLEFEIKNYVSGSFGVRNGNITVQTVTPSGNGVYSVTQQASGSYNTVLFFNSGSFNGQIDNVSVKQISNNTPRLDYSGTEPALLLEPQRTNLITTSNNSSTFIQIQNITVTDNAAIAPDNSNTAMLIESTDNNSKLVFRNFTMTAGVTYTASCYVKDINSTEFRILWYNNPVDQTDTFTSEYVGGGWTRLSSTFTATNTTSGIDSQLQFGRNFASGESLYLWGLQLEEGSYATSYIPTNGQTETRLAEGAISGGNASLFNDSEGVLYLEIDYLEETQLISITDGTNNEAIWIYNTSGNIRFYVFNGGAVQCNIVITTYDHTTDGFIKIAVKYKQNSFEVYANGVKTQQDTSGNTPTGLNVLKFSRGDGAYTFWPKANVRALYYFSEELTDTELQQLTSNT